MSSLKPGHPFILSSRSAGKSLGQYLLCAIFAAGCTLSDADPAPSFPGIATLKLTLTIESLHTLNNSRNNNVFVSAHMLYDYPELGTRTSSNLEVRNAGQFSRRQFQRYQIQPPLYRAVGS